MSTTNDGKPLDSADVVPEEFEDEDLYSGANDDGLGPADEDEDEPGLSAADRENQAGTEKIDRGKFQCD